MHAIAINEDEISDLADKISDVCDGHSAVAILVAMSDMVAALADAHPDLTIDKVMTDFGSLVVQRHGINNSQALN